MPSRSKKYEGTQSNDSVRIGTTGDQDRRLVRDYYGGQAKGGKCPPGLAKKGNGCMPQVRRRNGQWAGRCPATWCITSYRTI